eukprot:1781410-Prymnesium_polylepis.2
MWHEVLHKVRFAPTPFPLSDRALTPLKPPPLRLRARPPHPLCDWALAPPPLPIAEHQQARQARRDEDDRDAGGRDQAGLAELPAHDRDHCVHQRSGER